MLDKSSLLIRQGLAVVLGLVIIKFAVLPFFSWKGDAVDEITLLKRSIAHKKAFVGSEPRINKDLQNMKDAFEQAASFYYSDFSDIRSIQLKLQKDIENVSLSAGVNVKNTDWIHPSGETIISVPIKIMMETDIDRLVKFIKAIESHNKFLSIDNVKINSAQNSLLLSVMLEVWAYAFQGQK
ncbi:MAG: type 4a pilus biogenesis protein PilO [Deltaproteobacteria bacterium]|nr:type 4a pilus biogenesis protein PilO [Deltaproteobacteria bacterium]